MEICDIYCHMVGLNENSILRHINTMIEIQMAIVD